MAISRIPLADLDNSIEAIDDDNDALGSTMSAERSTIYAIEIDNTRNPSPLYTKFYNLDYDDVEVGITPPDMIIPLAGGKIVPLKFPSGLEFDVGIVAATVTTPGTAGARHPLKPVIVKIVYVDHSGFLMLDDGGFLLLDEGGLMIL